MGVLSAVVTDMFSKGQMYPSPFSCVDFAFVNSYFVLFNDLLQFILNCKIYKDFKNLSSVPLNMKSDVGRDKALGSLGGGSLSVQLPP